jgi:hypothetical protein
MIAAGLATRHSASQILDGSAPPGATSVAVPVALLITGGIAFLRWGSLIQPVYPQMAIFRVVLPIWAAVQAALILASTRVARPIAPPRESLGPQEEEKRPKLLDFLRSGWD